MVGCTVYAHSWVSYTLAIKLLEIEKVWHQLSLKIGIIKLGYPLKNILIHSIGF